MNTFLAPSKIDAYAAVLVLLCSPAFALMQGYAGDAMFGSIPRAVIASLGLGMLFTCPLFIYLAVKYGRMALRQATI